MRQSSGGGRARRMAARTLARMSCMAACPVNGVRACPAHNAQHGILAAGMGKYQRKRRGRQAG